MRLKYRFKTFLQFIAFAFYPKATLIACTVFSAIVIAILGIVMAEIPHDSGWYNLVFALTTGAAASFFVSFIVELFGNYRHNKLAWYELQDYFSVVFDFELGKQVLMRHGPLQQPKDLIQATWAQIPKIIPVLRKTLDEKKAFLSDSEIDELKNILNDFGMIRGQVKMLIEESSFFYVEPDCPDEDVLRKNFSKDFLLNMPDWLRKQIAFNESDASIDRLVDVLFSDCSLLAQFMKDYDISQHGLDSYSNQEDAHDDQEGVSIENDRPFVSWSISQFCSDIAQSIDVLERAILKQPYYSMYLEHGRNLGDKALDSHVPSVK